MEKYEDQEIIDMMGDLPSIPVSPTFKKEVHARIREQKKSFCDTPSPWHRCKPWVVALVAHAAVFVIIANLYFSHTHQKPGDSIRQILYKQRIAAAQTAEHTQLSPTGKLLISHEKPGALLRLVPLKECIGVFNYKQWSALASVTRSAYESEPGFSEVTLGRDKTLVLDNDQQKKDFKDGTIAVILIFSDRSEIWNASILQGYLDEYPVDIQKSAILSW